MTFTAARWGCDAMKIIAAIDPGAGGAIAFLNWRHQIIEVLDMPIDYVKVGRTTRRVINPALLAAHLRAHAPDHLFVENVSVRPGEGAVGAFAFGRGLGVIEGVCSALCIPMTKIRPQDWKRGMGCPADKGAARQRACELFPANAGIFSRVKDDGRAEAVMLGLFGIRALENTGVPA
ncbi:hypothetical protein ACLEIY_16040 [Acetobacter tropicalis]|nr:hypothetical protein [Acetobacter senegalensis]